MKLKIACTLLLLAVSSAHALDLEDSMQVWRRSPNALRVKVLANPAVAAQVGGNQAQVLACMNQVTDPKALSEKTVKETLASCVNGR